MRHKVSVLPKSKHVKINNSSVKVEVGTVKQEDTAKHNRINLIFESVSLNAILNAGGRADEVRCYPGTRAEIIGKIEKWMDGHSDQRMLWLSGHAGAGKSAIAQTVAERRADCGVHSANFFFFRGDPTRNHARPIVATLIYQLIKLYPSLRDHLANALTAQPLLYKASVSEQFTQLLASPVENVYSSLSVDRQIILIIDGLDECDDEAEQIQILNALHALASRKDSPFRVFIASRTEPHLVMFFNKLGASAQSIFLDEGYRPEEDIRKFVTAKFHDIKRTHHLAHTLSKDWPPETSIDKITNKSSGQFIYAASVMRFIELSKDSPAVSLLTVHEIRPPTDHSPFAQLDALYSHVFAKARNIRVIKWALSEFSQNNVPGVRHVWRYAGYTTIELESWFADIAAIARISIDRTFGLEVKFYHASLPDYLGNKSRSGIYHVDHREILVDMLIFCLQEFRDLATFSSIVIVIRHVDTPTTDISTFLLDTPKRKLGHCLRPEFWDPFIYIIIGLSRSGVV